MSKSSTNVRVCCRFRPPNSREKALGKGQVMRFLNEQTARIYQRNDVGEEKRNFKDFHLDRMFPINTTQKQVYEFAGKPVVESVLQGFNGTIFAYGQTSSGKTHTMQGPDIDNETMKGIIPRMVGTVFENIMNSPDYIEWTVKVGIVEIYCEKLRDLLDCTKINLKIREDPQKGIYVQDLTERYISDESEVSKLMHTGNHNRSTASTNMNAESSRSHLIFMLSIHQNNLQTLSAKTGKLFLIDLAGSEKIGKTGATGQTLKEAQKINQSLSALGNVINKLTDGKSNHIPYRDSCLTRLLQQSLGGNSKTTLVVTCSPSFDNVEETKSTLRFGIRAKSIKNKAKINREWTVPELLKLWKKSQKVVSQLSMRIKYLESIMKHNNLEIPKEVQLVTEEVEQQVKEPTEDSNAQDQGEEEEKFQNREVEKSVEFMLPEEKEKKEQDYSKEEEVKEEDISVNKQFSKKQKIIGEDGKERIVWDQQTQTDKILEKRQSVFFKEEVITSLEQELKSERHNVQQQTKTLNQLKANYQSSQEKCASLEKENDSLMQKLAILTIESKEQNQLNMEQDNTIQRGKINIDALKSEIKDLRMQNNELVDQLDAKELELESIQNDIIKQKLEKIKTKGLHKSPRKSQLDEEQKHLKIIEQLKKIAPGNPEVLILLKKFRMDDGIKPSSEKMIEQQIHDDQAQQQNLKDQKHLKEQYKEQCLLNEKLQEQNKELLEQNSQLMQKQGLDIDIDMLKQQIKEQAAVEERAKFDLEIEEIKQKIRQQASLEERTKFNSDKEFIMKDLENRINKVIQLEMLIDEYKEKINYMEGAMTDPEKQLKRKNKTLENSLEQLTLMYHQLVSERSALRVDKQILQKKLKSKRSKIRDIMNSYKMTKQDLNNFKRKCDMFKIHIMQQAKLNQQQMQISMNKKGERQMAQSKDYIQTGLKTSKNHPLQPNIRKIIRGGKNQQRSQTQTQLSHLPGKSYAKVIRKSNIKKKRKDF